MKLLFQSSERKKMKIDGAARFLAALKSNSYKREKGLWIEAASKRAARRWKAHYERKRYGTVQNTFTAK